MTPSLTILPSRTTRFCDGIGQSNFLWLYVGPARMPVERRRIVLPAHHPEQRHHHRTLDFSQAPPQLVQYWFH
jgi:hypothetical protein